MSVCVDASLVVKWVSREGDSEAALAWLQSHAGEALIAPVLLPIELSAVLHQKTRRQELTSEQAERALQLFERLRVRLIWDSTLVRRALDLAEELDQTTTYDTLYLALAETERCELWTADARFVRAAKPQYHFVHELGEWA